MSDHFRFPDTADWKRSDTWNPFVPLLEEVGEHVLRPLINGGLKVYDYMSPPKNHPSAKGSARARSAPKKPAPPRSKPTAPRRAKTPGKQARATMAPAAVNTRMARSSMRETRRNVYRSNEVVCEVLIPPAGVQPGFYPLLTTPVNPANTALFPKLARIAGLFEQYRGEITVVYEPISSTANQAIIGIFVDKDPSDAAPSSMAALLNNKYATAGAVWAPQRLHVDSRGRGILYTNSSLSVSTDSDVRLSQFGNLYVYLDYWNAAAAGTCVGYIRVESTFEFLNPKEPGPVSLVGTGVIAVTNTNAYAVPLRIDEAMGYAPAPVNFVGSTSFAASTATALGGPSIRVISPPSWPGIALRANETHYATIQVYNGNTATGTLYYGYVLFRAVDYSYLGSYGPGVTAPTAGQVYRTGYTIGPFTEAVVLVPATIWLGVSAINWVYNIALTPLDNSSVEATHAPLRDVMAYNLPGGYDALMAAIGPTTNAVVTVATDLDEAKEPAARARSAPARAATLPRVSQPRTPTIIEVEECDEPFIALSRRR